MFGDNDMPSAVVAVYLLSILKLAFSEMRCYTKNNTLIKYRGVICQKEMQQIWK